MRDSPLASHVARPAELRERLVLERSGRPFLVYRHPEDGQVLVALAGRGRVAIGRRAESDVALGWDTRVSRLHAELVLVGHDWVLSDDGLSANGTWIGETRLTGRHRLRDGDLIRIGDTLLAFCAPREARDVTLLEGGADSTVQISPAQRRVLVALCRPFLEAESLAPLTHREVAVELYLSIDAIKTHLSALFDAFDLDDIPPRQKRAVLIERAVRFGLVRDRDLAPQHKA